MFKQGDKVRCIKSITIYEEGCTYIVKDISDKNIRLVGEGDRCWHPSENFELVKEEDNREPKQ